jgi:hypothetical protein
MAGAGLALAASAAPLVGWLTSTPTGRRWSALIDDTTSDLGGVWIVLRGVYAYLLIPALLVLLAVLLVLAYRRSRRAACVFAAVALLTNLTVQFVKLAPLGIEQSPTALDPLSGHVGVAAGVWLGWLLVAPTPWRLRSAAVGAAVLVAVTSGVILTGWHSPFQVVCPLLMATGWATAVAAVVRTVGRERRPSGLPRVTWHGVAAIVSGLVIIAVASAVLLALPGWILVVGVAPVVLAALWTAGWCVVSLGVVLLASQSIAESTSMRPWGTTGPLIQQADHTS